jgi:hypothetical protein
MTLRHPIVFALAALLVLALSGSGFLAAVAQLPDSHTVGQKAQTYFQFGYALLGVFMLVAPFLARRWAIATQLTWAASLTGAGAFAPVVWGGTSGLVGMVAGVCTLLIAWGLLWLLRIGVRGKRSPSHDSGFAKEIHT